MGLLEFASCPPPRGTFDVIYGIAYEWYNCSMRSEGPHSYMVSILWSYVKWNLLISCLFFLRERIIVFKYISYSSKIKKPYITFLKSITMLCGIDCIWQNIPHIHIECEEYFVEYNQSHITLLWIWIMLYKNSMRLGGFFIIWHQDWL